MTIKEIESILKNTHPEQRMRLRYIKTIQEVQLLHWL